MQNIYRGDNCMKCHSLFSRKKGKLTAFLPAEYVQRGVKSEY